MILLMNEIYQSKIMQYLVIYLRNTYNERQLWCVEVIFLWNFWRRMQKFIVNNNHNKQRLSSLHRLIEVIFRHILKYGVSILTSFHPQVWESTNYEIGQTKKLGTNKSVLPNLRGSFDYFGF